MKLDTLYILSLCLFFGCKNDKFRPPVTANNPVQMTATGCANLSNVSYSAQVQPILNANCVSCHETFSGLRLSDYNHVVSYANNGQLIGCLNGDPIFLQMPLNSTMDSCSVKTIINWVQQGKLNN